MICRDFVISLSTQTHAANTVAMMTEIKAVRKNLLLVLISACVRKSQGSVFLSLNFCQRIAMLNEWRVNVNSIQFFPCHFPIRSKTMRLEWQYRAWRGNGCFVARLAACGFIVCVILKISSFF
jgi:hypothetical protein